MSKTDAMAAFMVCAFLATIFLVGMGIGESRCMERSRQAPTTITSPEGHTFYVTKDMQMIHTIPCDKCKETEK